LKTRGVVDSVLSFEVDRFHCSQRY